jgi:hypothetical protein
MREGMRYGEARLKPDGPMVADQLGTTRKHRFQMCCSDMKHQVVRKFEKLS